ARPSGSMPSRWMPPSKSSFFSKLSSLTRLLVAQRDVSSARNLVRHARYWGNISFPEISV
ncbi:MAG: hypothetical protein KDA80_17510, partial [Planctomycetaceae bacterium]|nr:hypothetical protein [Planctomycetaceae bacterium]